MKHNIIFLLISLSITQSANSQNYFNNLYGYGKLLEFDSEVNILDEDNSFIVVGNGHNNEFERGMIIRKMDKSGNLQWEDLIKDDTLSLATYRSSKHATFVDKKYVFIFSLAAILNDRELEYSLPVFIKYDILEREVVYKKPFQIAHSAGITSMILKDGFVYAVGNKILNEGFRDSDGLIVKLDLEGNLIWQKSFDFGVGDFMYEIEPLGAYFVVSGAYLPNPYTGKPFLLTIDTAGNIIKKIEPDINGGSGASDIEIIDSEIYYLVTSEEKIFEHRTQLLSKYNENLELQWDAFIPITSKYYLTGRRMEILNKQIIIAGNIRAVTDFTKDVYSYAISLSLDGQINWEHVYYYDDVFTHHLDDIEQMPNGDLVFMGTVFDSINTTDYFTDQYLWLFRTDSLGCGTVQETCYYTIDDYFTADTMVNIIEPQFTNFTAVQVLGNPFTTNLQIKALQNKPLQLQFYNTKGQLLTVENINGQANINTQHWPKGIYFMQVFDEGKLLAVEKLVKQ